MIFKMSVIIWDIVQKMIKIKFYKLYYRSFVNDLS